MYSVQQLQACDFILKRIIYDHTSPLFEKKLKLVIEFKGTFWYGDFVDFDGRRVSQDKIAEDGEVFPLKYSIPGNEELPLMNKLWSYYANVAMPANRSDFWTNPFTQIKSLPLLFDRLVAILNTSTEDEPVSVLFPYLFNAKSVDKKIELPFINLENEVINLVSIIEITE
ncbi:hypothetical protein B9T62_09130 [Paenibacillus donghaensis]|uniref:Uncharacterized protein n=2 Tax=Paenibacillus donghaensis TaxID=414771 RepID=A0A2Z2KJ37_9BACL|nr:hypothetical protein B9T62_09130 [Paenibacillus donghaensis]